MKLAWRHFVLLLALTGVLAGQTFAQSAEPVVEAPGSYKIAGTQSAEIATVTPRGPALKRTSWQRSVALPALAADAIKKLRDEDARTQRNQRTRIGVPRTFDKPVILNRRTASRSEWIELPDGWRIWCADITSAGALGMRLHVESLHLPAGARLVVYDPGNPGDAHPVTAETLGNASDAWMEIVFAEHAILECQVPPGADVSSVTFSVTGVSHIYRGIKPSASASPLQAAACEVDVSCYSSWLNPSHAVGLTEFVDTGVDYICSGCLLATTPATDIDYFLTANHCVGNQTVASTMEFWWLYQTSSCNGAAPSLSSVPHTTGGADLLATRTYASGNDFSFLRLRSATPGSVYYAGWSTATPASSAIVAGIHHPEGDYTRISFGTVYSSDTDFWYVQWYSGITEEGSSGSPLFNPSQQVIGQLYGGNSSCANPTGLDVYGRFYETFASISAWLTTPVNDVCTNAVALTNSTTVTMNTARASSTGDPTPTCSGTAGHGVWYKVAPNLNGPVTVSTCGSDYDTTLAVYTGSCGALAPIACNDDSCGTQAAVSFIGTTGTTYYILVAGKGGATGNLSIVAYWQAGCTFALSPTTQTLAGTVGTASFSVNAGSGCNWAASPATNWITIASGSSGSGTGTVTYSVASNTTTVTRSGTIYVAGQPFTVLQTGLKNGVTGLYDGISAGAGNNINGYYSYVGGGSANQLTGYFSNIGGGKFNIANPYTYIGGGERNTTYSYYDVIGGGYDNTSSNQFSTVMGGRQNNATGAGAFGGGGGWNGTSAVGNFAAGTASTVAGGYDNVASGNYAAIPGGVGNTATGTYAMVAGYYSTATNASGFVWSDASASPGITSTVSSQFTVRAAGGTRFFTDTAGSIGVQLAANDNQWSVLSDRNAKEAFAPVDFCALLDKLDATPVTEWSLKAQGTSVRHVGPMAQDFKAAFGLGTDDTHIGTADASGVALAGIKGLREIVEQKDAQIKELKHQNAELDDRISKLQDLLQRLSEGATP